MNGREMYDSYTRHMEASQSDPFDSFDDLSLIVQHGWDAFAIEIDEEIHEAVIEVLPGTPVGERSDRDLI